MDNILESYLVSLGFAPDEPSFHKFQTLMQDAERLVTDHSTGIAKRILEIQGTVTGVFTSISAGILGVVDKIAMQDQAWRLLGLRYMMSTESARKMDLVMKTLGASLEQIFWDPELRERAGGILHYIDRFSEGLGPNFEPKMKRIRDLITDLRILEKIGLQFLGMSFVEKLFDKLGLDDVSNKIHNLLDNLTGTQIEDFANQLADRAVPILKETWHIIEGIGQLLRETAVAFTNLVGLLSGDQSIQGTTFSFDNLLKAVEHVEHGFEHFLDFVMEAERLLSHFASAVSLLFSGKFGDAKEEFLSGLKELTTGSGAIIGGALGAPFGPLGIATGTGLGAALGKLRQATGEPKSVGQDFEHTYPRSKSIEQSPATLPPKDQDVVNTGILPPKDQGGINTGIPGSNYEFEEIRRWIRDRTGIGAPSDPTHTFDSIRGDPDRNWERFKEVIGNIPAAMRTGTWPWQAQPGHETRGADHWEAYNKPDEIIAAIEIAARHYGVPREMALAVANTESQFHEQEFRPGRPSGTLTSAAGALGVMQLMPATAAHFGVDPNDTLQNIDGGVRYLAELLKRYQGDQVKALEAYSAGPARVGRGPADLVLEQLPEETRKYVPKVLEYEREFSKTEPRTFAAAASSFTTGDQKAPATDARESATPNAGIDWAARFRDRFDEASKSDRSFGGSKNDALFDYLNRAPVPDMSVTHQQNHLTISVGDINITQPGADAYEIQRSVRDGIRDGIRSQTLFDIPQIAPAW